MRESLKPSRGRAYLAFVISIAIHSVLGLAWLLTPPSKGQALGSARGTEADEPPTLVLLVAAPSPAEQLPKIAEPPRRPEPLEPVRLPGHVTEPTRPAPSNPPMPLTSASNSGGGPTARPVHGPMRQGVLVVYLLDHSSSMGPDLLPRAIATLKASIGQLDPSVKFQVIAYNGAVRTFARGGAVPATAEWTKDLDLWLADLIAEGRSDHRGAFRAAVGERPDGIFLLTDADDLEEPDLKVIRQLVNMKTGVSVAVFGEGTARPAVETPLEKFTREHRGSVQFFGK